jgi:hypothetical protein
VKETRKFLVKVTINDYEKENKVTTKHLKKVEEVEIEWNGKLGKPATTNRDLIQLKEGEKTYNVICTSLQVKKGLFKDRIESHGFKLPPNSDFAIGDATIKSAEWRDEGKILIGGGVVLVSALVGLIAWFVFRRKLKINIIKADN